MPVRPVGRGCFKWGNRGHKYCGPGAEKKAERQGRAAYYNGYRGQEMMMASRGGTTYRITIKYWDRHYGDGHTQFSRRFEARTSKKADEEAIKILEDALRVHSKPQGRIAEAWAERSDRNGPKTLRKYDGSSGQWVEVTPMRPAEMSERPLFRRLAMREELREGAWYVVAKR